ncbi:MAG: hypothetical protein GYB33_18810 [Gammaproteobacteria bacterium]|uniref:hypothetical protein n=1 Tax=Pseudomaricurvus alcaniphilus TaxID=1166482 RepID=UPI00140DB35D|nr:hypothetical protein [Pseudomaricurvus alcaniphilus]MBR9912396.1 hypothetical protein [Gammaproteobacteria bacterium]NHN36771.1 hypothetical protein [Pseudomaricurvus alcaniphilus]
MLEVELAAVIEFQWRDTRLQQSSYRVQVGEQSQQSQHELSLQRCYRDPEGPVVFMLSGFGRDSRQFWPVDTDTGLAPCLAAAGFDVYVAAWRGKGAGTPRAGRDSRWGVHEIITVDIPALLGQVALLRPEAPCFWVGQGLSSVLLVASLCRPGVIAKPPLGIVHFGAARRSHSVWRRIALAGWQVRLQLSRLLAGAAAGWISRESERLFDDYRQWCSEQQWKDPVDGFNYRAAASCTRLPPSLYLQAPDMPRMPGVAADGGNTEIRLWLQELGRHDARIINLNRHNGNLHNYLARNTLSHRDACDDHFEQVKGWFAETMADKQGLGTGQA